MSRAKAFIVGCIGVFAFVASAHAADPAGSWRRPALEPAYEKPEPRFSELTSGWYLRADLGYRWDRVSALEVSTNPVINQDYGNVVAFGVGFGYKYQWFRADLTFEHAGTSWVKGTTAAATLQPQYTGKINANTALANLYIDLGTWAGFTPYVGGGVGVARLKSGNYIDSSLHPVPPTITGPGNGQNLAWALMAGVSFQIQPKWIIDAGFRHLHLGDVPGADGAQVTNSAAIFKNLSAQEARIGIRYLFE